MGLVTVSLILEDSSSIILSPISPPSSIFFQISWGFPARDCEVYIRPSKNVIITKVSLDTTPRGPPTPEQDTSYFCSPGAEPFNSAGVARPTPRSAFVFWPPSKLETMDTSAVVTLLALVMAMAGVSRALHIQGSLDKDDFLPGSEESMADHFLGLVSQSITCKLEVWI